MPQTKIVYYQESANSSDVVAWLKELRAQNAKAYTKCATRIQRLVECGHELRRPEADYLRDDIYELRATLNGVHYRLLYFFHGKGVAVLSWGLTKEAEVPAADIDRAIERRKKFLKAPSAHTYTHNSRG